MYRTIVDQVAIGTLGDGRGWDDPVRAARASGARLDADVPEVVEPDRVEVEARYPRADEREPDLVAQGDPRRVGHDLVLDVLVLGQASGCVRARASGRGLGVDRLVAVQR